MNNKQLAQAILEDIISVQNNKNNIQQLRAEIAQIERDTVRKIADAGAYDLLKLHTTRVRRLVQHETDYII